jgi:hypothetical protein
MSTGTNPAQEPNPTLLAALYQVTARWYANDAQLVHFLWIILPLFISLIGVYLAVVIIKNF